MYSSKIPNPFVSLKGLAQICIGGEKVEKISDKPLRYISKSYEDFTNYMESEGYTVEQLGRGFQLQKVIRARTDTSARMGKELEQE